jgi:hypothetical protein
MTIPEIIALLEDMRFPEVYHRTTFECYRRTETGGVQEVIVTILDSGQDSSANGGPRYHVYAQGEDGRSASGNGADDLRTAICTVHWHQLDKPPRPPGRPTIPS